MVGMIPLVLYIEGRVSPKRALHVQARLVNRAGREIRPDGHDVRRRARRRPESCGFGLLSVMMGFAREVL